ncbi:MAG: M23 family metallopeptidase [Sphingobium sp.]|nr:M23 family metallopeptidase [Sphingobium sp.]
MASNIGWPLAHNIIRRGDVANTFGMVRHNADGSKRPHQGWDFFAPVGTPCFALADGHVALVASGGDYGNVVALSFVFDGQTRYATYAHMSKIEVAQGQAVTRGQRIGLSGDSGNARGMTGPDQHLHFEVRTEPRPGRGLAGRISPLNVFRKVPLDEAVDV